jgi:hypothetical protein
MEMMIHWEHCQYNENSSCKQGTDPSLVAASWLVISVVIVKVPTGGGEGRTGGQVL